MEEKEKDKQYDKEKQEREESEGEEEEEEADVKGQVSDYCCHGPSQSREFSPGCP